MRQRLFTPIRRVAGVVHAERRCRSVPGRGRAFGGRGGLRVETGPVRA